MSFPAFDPLRYKSTADSDVAAIALKREIKEILGSYVGWYDPFSELLQNSLDSVEQRKKEEKLNYVPTINIIINLSEQLITVTDNGIGLTQKEFNQFLIPFFSFKSNETRGHKGVGATFLAYGFNYLQVVTKTDDFQACGKMVNARFWLNDKNPSGNPEMQHDSAGPIDSAFQEIDKGVSITVKIDVTTHPKDLKWIGTSDPTTWIKILRVKTGLGAFFKNGDIVINVKVIDANGNSKIATANGIEYLHVEQFDNIRKHERIRILQSKLDDLYKKKGFTNKIPSSLENFDCLHEFWEADELEKIIELDENERQIIALYAPAIYCGYAYSAKIFNDFNESLKLRANYKIITGGFQIASNNMPQGEIFQIPLQRYIGRQNQIHFVLHFSNYNADLGRKGYNKDITDFCKSITEKVSTKYLNKFKQYLRASTGVASDIIREKKVSDWKDEMKLYESKNPLVLINENFFIPTKQISITSVPTREQDVISLFNQLIAGGVIRGIKIMSTNERFTYDGLYRIYINKPTEHHIYSAVNNPLGILPEKVEEDELPFISNPSVLEYKYSLDGLIEDIIEETKNSNDIGLVVVWETGDLYKDNYHITSLVDTDNLSLRQYHGITHIITNLTTEQKEMDLIILSELIEYLNDPEACITLQKEKYDQF